MNEQNKNKILVGVATNGTGGVDSYILSFVKVAYSQDIYCDVVTTKFSNAYAEKLKENDANLIAIANLHNKKSIYQTIEDLNNKNNYVAAYWNISTAIMYPYVKASSDCNINNIVVHSHAHYNSQPTKLKTFIFDSAHYFYRILLSKLNVKYAACSTDCAKWIAGNKIVEQNKWTFVPNPIDAKACKYNETKRNLIREKLNIENKYVFGCATAFMPYKNPLFLIEVFSEIRKLNKNAYLLIAGDGPMKKDVEKLASGLLTDDSYKLLGHTKDVPDLLQALDCFILPSKNEGLPLCILEAQAASLPCVMSTNITREAIVLQNLVTRISFKHSAKEWAKKILAIGNDANERKPVSADIVSDAGFNLDSPKKILPVLGF